MACFSLLSVYLGRVLVELFCLLALEACSMVEPLMELLMTKGLPYGGALLCFRSCLGYFCLDKIAVDSIRDIVMAYGKGNTS